MDAYLLTISCYGSRLHGDARGTLHRDFGPVSGDAALHRHEQTLMQASPYRLDSLDSRRIALSTIRDVALFRGWRLLAAHVRVTHMHVIVAGTVAPSKAIGDFKAYVSRALNALEGERRRWARGGNSLRLRKHEVDAAIDYVVCKQGAPLECWFATRSVAVPSGPPVVEPSTPA
jgi:REP element-mobilizing transposase RayT